MFFLLVVLKVPIVGMIYLLWWAAQPEQEEPAKEDGDGGEHARRRPMPNFPRGPRRDPHGGGARPIPNAAPHGGRIRQLEAARALERSRSREIIRK